MEEPGKKKTPKARTNMTKMMPIIRDQLKVLVRVIKAEDEELEEEEDQVMSILRGVRRGRLIDALSSLAGAIDDQKRIDKVPEDMRKKTKRKPKTDRTDERTLRAADAETGPAGSVLTGADR